MKKKYLIKMGTSENIRPGRAIFALIFSLLFMVALPYYLIVVLLPSYFTLDPAIATQLLNSILLWGIIGSAAAFFKALFAPGTRPHGIFSALFAGYSVYYLYFIFTGGLSGEFGVLRLSLSSFSVPTNLQSFIFGVDLAFFAYFFIIIGVITVILYIYEIIV